MNRREWIILSNERDMWAERVNAAQLVGFDAGYLAGRDDGYQVCADELKAIHTGVIGSLDLELARWGPKGREHYGDPRPGDYTGQADG